jgi:predicted AAA+ superfamily ATPase
LIFDHKLFIKAGIAHIVYHSSSSGLPLGAEVNPLISKVIFLDVALAQSVLGIDCGQWILDPVHSIINRGAITESFVGQELLAYGSPFIKNQLYYWIREQRGGLAEVDYTAAVNGQVVPIEVKSGKTGSLKSIQVFLEKKRAVLTVYSFHSEIILWIKKSSSTLYTQFPVQ